MAGMTGGAFVLTVSGQEIALLSKLCVMLNNCLAVPGFVQNDQFPGLHD